MSILKIFSGNSNPKLAEAIADYFQEGLSKATVSVQGNTETRVEIIDNVRGMDVFIIQPTCQPVNTAIMELLIMIDAVRRASADRITAVIPYFGYARQDSKTMSRAPITARLVADLIIEAGANRVLAMDFHAGQMQGFFKIPSDNLQASTVILPYLRGKYRSEIVVVAPHTGGGDMARAYAKRLNAPLAIIDKRKDGPDGPNVLNIIGDVDGLKAVVVSDMIDTAITMTEAAAALYKKGATEVIACATHAVLSEPAVERIKKSELKEVVITDTIPLSQAAAESGKFQVLSVSGMLAKAIYQIHHSDSLGSLFI